MKVYKQIDALPTFKNAVITIGTFDGVHRGHQQIIRQLLQEAANVGGTAVLITFYPHPKNIIAAREQPLFTINTADEKYELLHQHGIEHIVVVPFNKSFAQQSATGYIQNFLVNRFHPHTIIIGYDHRFGQNRSGDYKLLESEAAKYNFQVKEIPEHVLLDVTISSTKIREALLDGDIETAAVYLGYSYFFTGKVIESNKLGRTIGYPTANLHIEDSQKLVPGYGVYAVTAQLEGRKELYKGMMNIGLRPTVDGSARAIEVNIFKFDEIIYGRHVTVTLIKKLRNEVKFDSLEALKAQLAKDKINAENALDHL